MNGKSAGRELFRVGVPVRAAKLLALLDTMEPSDEATVRHYNGALIIEEPERTLLSEAASASGLAES